MEIKKISSIDKFYKLVSFYNSLSNLYFDLSAYHDNKDIEGYNDVINNIKNIFEFINEYIVENINLDDFIVISEYYENHEYCNEFGVLKCEEFIATKIYCTLKNIYDNNLNCCVIPLIHEKVEQLISESYEEERDNIDDLSEDGLKLYVYKKYESEIKEKAVHEIFINTFNTEVSTETCMCFLMVLESKIKDEKDINLRQKLISIYYNTIFANDNVQLLLITNNFILENYVCFSEMYENFKNIKTKKLSNEIKKDIVCVLDNSNESLKNNDKIEDFYTNLYYLQARLILIDRTNFTLLWTDIAYGINKIIEDGEYEEYSIAIDRVKKCYEEVSLNKISTINLEKEEEMNLEIIKKINDKN